MQEDLLILVNDNDEPVGAMPKMEAHLKGVLHRAFSVFLFNSKGEMLLQQRALQKYHSAGLWSNTCCSHPIVHEAIEDSLKKRLNHEMGMEADVEFLYKFKYKVALENGFTEHEMDHVYFGISDDQPNVNPEEVKSWKYLSMDEVKHQLEKHPEQFSVWFRICFPEIERRFKNKWPELTLGINS